MKGKKRGREDYPYAEKVAWICQGQCQEIGPGVLAQHYCGGMILLPKLPVV
jgi:hypothetical protein